MSRDEGPMVSCLCVSRPERWGQLQRSILDFSAQTYANSELVVVVDRKTDYASMVEGYVIKIGLSRVKVFARPITGQLDGLVYAMCQARGDLIAVWDDDNMNAPGRLATQVHGQRQFPNAMTALGDSLYYFHESNELFVTNYETPGAPASERCAASTLMCPRDVFPALEPRLRARPVEMLLNDATKRGVKLVAVWGGYTHVVGVTHDNARSYDLHRRLSQCGGHNAAWLSENRPGIITALDAYIWDAASITVSGSDAAAFEYAAANTRATGLFPLRVKDDSIQESHENVAEA